MSIIYSETFVCDKSDYVFESELDIKLYFCRCFLMDTCISIVTYSFSYVAAFSVKQHKSTTAAAIKQSLRNKFSANNSRLCKPK